MKTMKLSTAVLVVALLAVPATAFGVPVSYSYGWEDGGTILGSYGNLGTAVNVSGDESGLGGPSASNTGLKYLRVSEDPLGGTPQAFVAFVTGLTAGDIVDADFFGWDNTPGSSPSMRIWGSYALNTDITSYQGSAGGNTTYTGTTDSGWSHDAAHSWTIAAGKEALVIQARLYSPTAGTAPQYFWIDDITVTAPDTAAVHFAPEPATLALLAFGGLLLRRRR